MLAIRQEESRAVPNLVQEPAQALSITDAIVGASSPAGLSRVSISVRSGATVLGRLDSAR